MGDEQIENIFSEQRIYVYGAETNKEPVVIYVEKIYLLMI